MTIRTITGTVLLLLALSPGLPAQEPPPTVKRVFADFAALPCKASEWSTATGKFTTATAAPEGAAQPQSMELTVSYSGKGFEHFAVNPLNPKLPGKLRKVTLWARTSTPGYAWLLNFGDAKPKVKDEERKLEYNLKLDGTKWTRNEFLIPADWVQPVSFAAVTSHNWSKQKVKAEAVLNLHGLELECDLSEVKDQQALFSLTCSTGVEANVFTAGDPIRFNLDFDSWLGKELKANLAYEITDSLGASVARDTRALTISGALHHEITPQPPRFGVYEYTITVTPDGLPEFRKSGHFAYLPKPPSYTVAEKVASPFALVIHGGMTDVTYGAYAKMGFTWVRDYAYSFAWMKRAKGDNGRYEGWPWYPKMDQKLTASGLLLLPCLMGTIAEGTGAGNLKMTKETRAEIIRIMLAFPQYRCWELDNEYDYKFGKEESTRNWSSYQAYHQAFAETVDFMDDTALAVENGTAGVYPERTRDCIKSGAFDKIDVINAHFYCGTDAPELNKTNYNVGGTLVAPRSLYDTLRDYVAVASCDGKKRQAWITEFGWDTLAGHIVTEAEQAAYLQRGYMLGLQAGLDKMFWYWNMDTKDKPKTFFDGCGLLDPKVEPKPAVAAMAALVHFMKQPQAVGTFDLGDNAMGYVFRDSGTLVAAAFKVDGTQPDREVELPGATLFDTFANPLPGSRVKLGIAPVWLRGLDETSALYRQTAFDLKSHYYNRITAGDSFTIELRARNNRREALTASFALQLPKGWSTTHAAGEIAAKPGETVVLPIVITADPKEATLYQKVPLLITEKGVTKTLNSEFDIVTAGTLKATPLTGTPGTCPTTVTLRNNSSSAKSFVLKAEVPKSWKITPAEIAITDLPGAMLTTKEFTVTWNTDWAKDEKARISLVLPDGRVIAETPIIPPALALQELTQAITFDGDLKDWPAAARLPDWALGTTATQPATEVYAGYSAEGLYVAVNVMDSKVSEGDPRSFWAQDCLELFVDSRGDRTNRKEYAATDHQFWICPQTKDKKVYAGRWKRNQEIPATVYELPGVRGASVKTATGYRMEFLIPAAQITGFKAAKGTKIGLNLNLSVTHAKRDNYEVFWPMEKADKVAEKPYIWGAVELK